jgi:hypothetical protein
MFDDVRRYLRSLSTMDRLRLALLMAPAAYFLLDAPFWGVLLGAALGLALYAFSDLAIPGYRLIVVLAIALPGSDIGGTDLPFDGMSAVAAIVTFLACFAIFDRPSRVRADLRHVLVPRG